jgi:two-component system phosphate regulon sensor histidine kinase PhoR
MRKQLNYSYFFVIMIAILGTSVAFCSLGYNYLKEENYNRFAEEAMLIAGELEEKDMTDTAFLEEFVKDTSRKIDARISIINDQGTVFADSESMTKEDHSYRKEVREALKGNVGKDMRKSSTTGISFYYTAVKMENNGTDYVIRIAMPQKNFNQLMYRLVCSIVMVSVFCLIVATMLVYLFIRKITNPVYEIAEKAEQIAGGDYNVHIRPTGSGHILLLSKSLNHMVESLRSNQKILEQQNKDLKEYEKMQAQFVSNVTHELKTPLTSIRGFVDTLREGAVNDEKVAMRFLEIIDIEAKRLSKLIDDVLSLSKIEQKNEEIGECDVVETAKEAEEILRMKMKQKNLQEVRLIVDIEEDIPYYPCDSDHLKEVLLNLVDNALNYTMEGTVELHIFQWNKMLYIQVKDTGIGIAKEHLPRLFDRFYRVDKGRSRKQGGTGLGLSIVKHIVDLYNGTIEVESTVGYGTTFRICFPYTKQ